MQIYYLITSALIMVIFFYRSVVLFRKSFFYFSEGIKVEGTIVEYKKVGKNSLYSTEKFQPRISYKDKEGKSHEVLTEYTYLFKLGNPGSKIKIIYDSTNPLRIVVNDFFRLWFPTMYSLLFFLGGLTYILNYYIFLTGLR